MKAADFDYQLSPALIAQTPADPRDSSRLLVLDRSTEAHEHRRFHELPDYLLPGDLLVANDSRVLPARLYGRKQGSNGRVELLLLARIASSPNEQVWEALVRPGRRLREGTCIELGEATYASAYSTPAISVGGNPPKVLAHDLRLRGEIVGRTDSGGRLVRLRSNGDIDAALLAQGVMPLPPYIHQPLADPDRYQTVYARALGSAAAPTAGLHFTNQLMMRLEDAGIHVSFVTLHIGLDTFRPLKVLDVEQHQMHSEFAELSLTTSEALNAARRAGHRIIAVGTTAVRVLETAASPDGVFRPHSGPTSIFIFPGYRFRAIDGLITNFHLPRSTLIMLVSAFAGRENTLAAYRAATKLHYRFYSFGDAMLIL